MEGFFKDPKTLQRMHSGPLNEYIDLFAQRLCELGYTRISGRIRLRRIAHFSAWPEKRGLRLCRVTPHLVGQYLRRHGDSRNGDVATLKAVLDWLRKKAILRETRVAAITTPARQFENEFALYLAQERGLAPATIENHRLFVRRFLARYFGNGRLDLSELCAQDIVDFVRQRATLQPRRANLMTTALRSFLRYARYRAMIKTDLAAAVPGVANWSLSSLPKALRPEQVELTLTHCNRQSSMGRRDYAVLLLLARLGLRAGEVASLTLDDIDWEAARITVRGKGRRRSELPLPADVGDAIADYLRGGRPQASSRLVFLRGPAPVAGFRDHRGICLIVKHALARAGIHSPRHGAHQFRHTLAKQMLARGASLAEIGDLLRHASPRTTAIYAKVDLPALRPLALPWPGGAQ
jgi:integrase/recombinase XerD